MASTTVATFLLDVRYDLNDHGKQKWNDTYLVRMLNRGIRILERELINVGSGLVQTYTTATLAAAANSVELTSAVDSIKRIYISQTELYHITMEQMLRRRIDVIGTSTGQPQYFALWIKPSGSSGRSIAFDYTADQEYTITYIYNARSSDLTTASYMPYDDMFNDYLREGIVILCQKAKKDDVVPIDNIFRDLFRRYMFAFNLTISSPPRYYVKDY